ncbi:pyruvate kinase PKM [Cephus cinctus]|uniref:Pyruvate kinase n=1 Tax=Cephus cinctus TaxID=211228 RepID=A0AAJ7BM97_CEPCN|nr:pyruvate kinase PKM [Cephus cinctus]XP_024937971.1 pyruvate kinase PKM [Cephus cinctus]
MCSSENVSTTKSQCHRMPWIMRLGDEFLPESQLGAAYQTTRMDHEMRLNVNCNPRPGRLTGLMITLGDNNSHPNGIRDIISAGVDMLRINMSHKDEKWHAITVQSIKEAEQSIDKCSTESYPVGITMDLRGPEIRTGIFNGDENNMGYADLKEGNTVRLMIDNTVRRAGAASCFWVSCPELPGLSQIGDRILIDRGTVELIVIGISECYVTCKIVKGGRISNEKIVHLIDTSIDLPQVSEQDDIDIGLALEYECDFLIVSHARDGKMICAVKDRAKQLGLKPICVLGKISTQQGLDCFDDILKVSDGIMVDRTGIEVHIQIEKVFVAQKSIIAKCNRLGKPVIVAFDVKNQECSHGNMSQIANAVLEGADSIHLRTGNLDVMETIQLVKKVDIVCREAESARWQRQLFEELSYKTLIPLDPTHSISVAAVETSMKCNAAAIVVTTTTGRTAMMLSIYRPRCPIIAITRYGIVARWLQIYFGVHPVQYQDSPLSNWCKDMDARIQCAMDYLRREQLINVGDAVVIVSGWRQGGGFTNCIRLVYASPGRIPNRGDDFEESW